MNKEVGIISVLLAISIIGELHAQPVFTEANSLPPFGQQICLNKNYATNEPQTFITSGTNVAWDFSQIPWEDQGTVVWNVQPTSWTDYEDLFTFSNYSYWTVASDGTQFFNFLEQGPDSLLVSGSAYFLDWQNTDWSYACPFRPTWLRYPAGVGSVVFWPEHECNGSTITFEREIVASGSLELGFAQFDDVLLIRHTRTVGTDVNISYNWYAIGNAYFTVMGHGNPGYTAAACNTSITAVDEEIADALFVVIPNPASDNFRAVWSERSRVARLTILDAQGRQVLEVGNLQNGSEEISVQGLANGAYSVVLDDEQGRRVQRIVVAH